MAQPLDIAVIGMAGVYPQAPDVSTFWRNICAKLDATREADADWVGPYFEADTTADDRLYTTRGGFLGELAQVDPLELGLMPSIAAGSDPDHLISLKVAREALLDAGLVEAAGRGALHWTQPLDRQRAGVVLARGTYGNRGLAGMLARGLFLDPMMSVIAQLRPDFSAADLAQLKAELKRQLPPYGGDLVGVLTPNVIAGLIANRLDLMGPSYLVDAACASGLIALDAAVQALASGRCDLMLCGGTQVQTPPQLFIQFCQIQALSRDRLRPFQAGAEGTLLGEGCGMLVLKRRADAEAAGDRIYALIRGIGIASDGRAKGLLAPRLEGEVLALQRAYAQSGIDPASVDLIEAHGTGTRVGDATEMEALTQVFGGRGAGPRIALSAVKSMIGHCLPATATASLIKTALALHERCLPPLLSGEPDPALGLARTPFYLNHDTRPWIHGGDTPRRAGVNAFGFGGINAHAILEAYRAPLRGWVQGHRPPAGPELLAFAAEDLAGLRDQLAGAQAALAAGEPLETVAQRSSSRGAHRLALVVEPAQARERLARAADALAAGQPFRQRGGAEYTVMADPAPLCLLFPGEGSQYPGQLAEAALRFPRIRAALDFIEAAARRRGSPSRAAHWYPPPGLPVDETALHQMDVGAESVFAASLALHAFFEDLGVQPQAMLGHSTGENTALTVSGVRPYESAEALGEAIQAVHALYRECEARGEIGRGVLLSVGALDRASREALLAEEPTLCLAMDNCPNQVVLFGPPEACARAEARLAAAGAICQRLPFDRGYHTPAFAAMAAAFRRYFEAQPFGPGRVRLYSACSAAPFPDEPAAIRALAARQWEAPVRFTETLQRLADDGIRCFLELGPGATLSGFVTDTLRDAPGLRVLSADARRGGGLKALLGAVAGLHLAGHALDLDALHRHRRPLAPRRAAAGAPLRMPVFTLPEAWRRPLPVTAPVAAAAPAVAGPGPLAAPAVEPAAEPAADPRQRVLLDHFALMQAFLDSQARVLTAVSGAAAPGPAGEPAAAAFPLLGTVRERSETQLLIERDYRLDRDLFLRDHGIGGAPSRRDPALTAIPVIPFTFSLEICAEAAVSLLAQPGLRVVAIEQARGSRWLALDADGRGEQLRLRIEARREAPRGTEAARVQVRLWLPGEGAATPGLVVFEAGVLLAEHYPAPPPPLVWASPQRQPPRFNADPAQLYQRGMFHGPRLQAARALLAWGERDIEMALSTLPCDQNHAGLRAPRYQIDPVLLDALGQTFYYWLQEQHGGLINCFPFQIGRLTLYAPPAAPATAVRSHAQIQLPAPDRLAAVVEAREAASGRLLMRAEDWEDKTFVVAERFYRFRLDPPAGFLGEPWLAGVLPAGLCARRVAPFEDGLLDQGGGIWGRGLAFMTLTRAERSRYYALPATGSRREEWLLGRIAAKEAVRDWFQSRRGLSLASADIEIRSDPQGRPSVVVASEPGQLMPVVSLSHSQGWAAAVATDPGLRLGFDYQRLDRVRAEDLVRGAFGPDERAGFEGHASESLGLIATALWCAKEAAAKAAGRGLEGRPLDWRVVEATLDPLRAAVGSARIHHAGEDYAVALRFEGRSAVSALCLAPLPLTAPLATAP